MMGKPLPKGKKWDDCLSAYDLLSAVKKVRDAGEKLWFRFRGDETHRYEVWPDGRNIAWPLTMLEARRKRQEPLAEGHRCKHVWETHTDSEPTAAGMHVEVFRQCFKCGEIKEG